MTELFNREDQTPLRKHLRNNATVGERILWSHLKHSQLNGNKFRRQCGIGKYVADFYCPRLRLAVEIDGLSHYDEDVFENDQVRQKYIESLGITVKRYNSQDVFYKIHDVLEDLYQTCLVLAGG